MTNEYWDELFFELRAIKSAVEQLEDMFSVLLVREQNASNIAIIDEPDSRLQITEQIVQERYIELWRRMELLGLFCRELKLEAKRLQITEQIVQERYIELWRRMELLGLFCRELKLEAKEKS